jgi:hypothetical protein
MVRRCVAQATSAIEDFLVCKEHDSGETRAILEQLNLPCLAVTLGGVRLVLRSRPLEESDLVPVPL